jgi:hypothetical protein
VPVAAPKRARRVYPYSIIPGGVSDRTDVARMVATDKVVAAHYASLDVSKVRELTVTRPRAVYVSYRKGDKVYWTAKKLMLAEGETLLSDGSSEIRTRCGNRISDVPQLPVEVKGPTPEELDSPVEEAQLVPEQGGLSFASFGMDEIGNVPSFAGQAYQLPTSVNAATLAQVSSESPFRGKPGHLPLADGLDAVPVTVVDWVPHGVAGGSTDSPPAAGNSGSGGTPDTPTVLEPSPIQTGGGTGNTSETQAPVTPAQPTVPAGPVPGKPVPTTPNAGPKVPPSIPDELLSPSPFPPVQPGKAPTKPGEVPEPTTLWLSGAALAAMLMLRRKGARG